jgi:hypothetical protein
MEDCMAKRFRVVLEKDPNSIATGITIPFDVQKIFGTRARVPVRGTINGFPFRSSIFPMGKDGCHMMAVNRGMREGAKATAGDLVSVVMERDNEPRVARLRPTRPRSPRGSDSVIRIAKNTQKPSKKRRSLKPALDASKKPSQRSPP